MLRPPVESTANSGHSESSASPLKFAKKYRTIIPIAMRQPIRRRIDSAAVANFRSYVTCSPYLELWLSAQQEGEHQLEFHAYAH